MRWRLIHGVALLAVATGLAPSAEVRGAQIYSPPSLAEVRQAAGHWLAARNPDAALQQAVEQQWAGVSEAASVDERFDALMRTFYLADEDVRTLVDACMAGDVATLSAGLPALSGEPDSFFHANVKYFYARYLAVLTLFDESLQILETIDPAQVVDPAGCLFYEAVCQHRLMQKEAGLKTIESLLTSTEAVPLRYATVAELMQHDLTALRENSLDEVSRQMRDVERRLALGRAGEQVQRVEERIITTLDDLIEKLEQQQGGGGGGGGRGQPRGSQSDTPADDSYVGGATGPGEVDRRELGHKDGWGDLPDKAQTAAKDLIKRQFPFHYRQAVEEYLKRIAQRPAPSGE